MADDTFVNYAKPDDLRDRKKRRKVSSYIGSHFRNRSRPLAKRLAKEQSGNGEHKKADTSTLTGHRQQIVPPILLDVLVELPRDRYGVRDDPFKTWPIEFKSGIPSAIEYFIHFYGPSHSIRPEHLDIEQGNKVVHAQFRYAMQSPVMFEAIVTLSRANLTINTWTNHLPDQQTLHHYGTALARLRTLITGPDPAFASDDAVLFAIVALMGVDFLRNDMGAFQAHLAGLRKLIGLRGGIDSLGWPKLLKPAITSLEILWTYVCSAPQLLPAGTPIIIPPYVPVQAPVHPMSSTTTAAANHTNFANQTISTDHTISAQISTLPPSFRHLALTHPLTPPILHLIHQTTHYDIHLHHTPSTHQLTRNARPIPATSPPLTSRATGLPLLNASNLATTDLALSLLSHPATTRVERLVCIALLCVLLDVTRAEKLAPLVRRQVGLWMEEVVVRYALVGSAAERDLVAWVCLNLGAAVLAGWMVLGDVEGEGEVLEGQENAMGKGSDAAIARAKTRTRDLLGSEWRVRCVRKVVQHFVDESERRGEAGLLALRDVPEQVLTGFLWTDACRDANQRAWRAVWEEMVAERGLGVGEDVERGCDEGAARMRMT